MTKRGKILRDASAGPGLLLVDGQHYQFSLEGVWRSAVPPTAGMSVDVEFAADASIVGISQVSDAQIAKEQAEAVVKAARQKGAVLASVAIAKFGLPLLIATGLMIVGWFFLNAVSIQTPWPFPSLFLERPARCFGRSVAFGLHAVCRNHGAQQHS